MKCFAIVMKDHYLSEVGYEKLWKSSKTVENEFQINRFDAVTPEAAVNLTHNEKFNLVWSWPWDKENYDFYLEIKKIPYQTSNPYARVGCFLSHYNLWEMCVKDKENYLILEHDALFIRKFHEPKLNDGDILAINDPRGATRKAQLYHEKIQSSTTENFVPVPWIDNDMTIPQGLPGNSAYVITPSAADRAITLTKQFGMWPNDALLCKQLFQSKLFVLKDYATRVQGLMSTTTQ